MRALVLWETKPLCLGRPVEEVGVFCVLFVMFDLQG